MKDSLGRTIDYLRVSLTDRCNFRCRYCMPGDVPDAGHESVLSYEELAQVCAAAVRCGITKFKITGGEPLVRKGAVSFMERLKRMAGVRQVTLTTNGYLLARELPKLAAMGIDGINISLDTLDRRQFWNISGVDGLERTMAAMQEAVRLGIRTKINAVLLAQTADQIVPLARLAQRYPIDVRFIELMPIGFGVTQAGGTAGEAFRLLRHEWPDVTLTAEPRGNGPATYYQSRFLQGRIGFIAANTHRFCRTCNRLRLTSTGFLKPCLCYGMGVAVRQVLRVPGDHEETLAQAVAEAIAMKPKGHCFSMRQEITEHKQMIQIGG